MYCTVDSSQGDHHTIILDAATIGEPCYWVVHPLGCQLNCSLPNVKKSYVQLFETYAHSHCLEDKLCQIFHLASTESTLRSLLKETMECFDCIKAEGIQFAEKNAADGYMLEKSNSLLNSTFGEPLASCLEMETRQENQSKDHLSTCQPL